jgi:hypothetical protein
MRVQMACFSSGVMKTQLQTSRAVLPQPWQTSSNKVEQIPMQGESKLSGLIAKGRAGLESGLFEFVIGFLFHCRIYNAWHWRISFPLVQAPVLGIKLIADSSALPEQFRSK